MATYSLKQEVHKAWLDHQDAAVQAYGFPPNSKIVADDLQRTLTTADDEQLKAYAALLRGEAQEWRSMKFVGEA